MSAARRIARPSSGSYATNRIVPMSHDLAELGASLVGARVGDRYDVEAVLGAGGMGCVLAARHRITRRRVALKVVPYDAATDATVAARFALEAQAPCALDHPNIVEVLDAGADEARGLLYVAQELLEGVSLERHLAARGRLPWQETLAIVVPVASALAAAHAAGLTHRDLKPANLHLALEHGVVVPKLLDWGIARATWAPHVTVAGAVFGTPAYMAPEQARGESDVGPQADVWALGVLLHECIAGTVPFDGSNYNATLAAVLTAPVPRLDALVPGVPRALADVVARALARDRARRWASVDALLAGLVAAVDLPGLPWIGLAPLATPALAPLPEDVALTTRLAELRDHATEHLATPRRVRQGWLAVLGVTAAIVGLGIGHVLPTEPQPVRAVASQVRPVRAVVLAVRTPVRAPDPTPVAPPAPIPPAPHAARPPHTLAPSAPRVLAARATSHDDAGHRELIDPWTAHVAPVNHNGAPLLEP